MAANTNSPSVVWVAGESTGFNGQGASALVPTPFTQATNTTVPTAAPVGGNFHITSGSNLYLWNGSAWVGAYGTS